MTHSHFCSVTHFVNNATQPIASWKFSCPVFFCVNYSNFYQYMWTILFTPVYIQKLTRVWTSDQHHWLLILETKNLPKVIYRRSHQNLRPWLQVRPCKNFHEGSLSHFPPLKYESSFSQNEEMQFRALLTRHEKPESRSKNEINSFPDVHWTLLGRARQACRKEFTPIRQVNASSAQTGSYEAEECFGNGFGGDKFELDGAAANGSEARCCLFRSDQQTNTQSDAILVSKCVNSKPCTCAYIGAQSSQQREERICQESAFLSFFIFGNCFREIWGLSKALVVSKDLLCPNLLSFWLFWFFWAFWASWAFRALKK